MMTKNLNKVIMMNKMKKKEIKNKKLLKIQMIVLKKKVKMKKLKKKNNKVIKKKNKIKMNKKP